MTPIIRLFLCRISSPSPTLPPLPFPSLAPPAFPMVHTFPMFHSVYDNYHWMATFADPLFKRHVAIAKMMAGVAARLAGNHRLPFNYTAYAVHLEHDVARLQADVAEQGTPSSLSVALLFASVSHLLAAAQSIEAEIKVWKLVFHVQVWCTAVGSTAVGCTAVGCTAVGCTAVGCTAVGVHSGGMHSGGMHSGGMHSGGMHSGGMHSGGMHSGGMHSGGMHSGGMHSGGMHSGAWGIESALHVLPNPSIVASAAQRLAAVHAGARGGGRILEGHCIHAIETSSTACQCRGGTCPMEGASGKGGNFPASFDGVNERLFLAERGFLDRHGIGPQYTWFKHLGFGGVEWVSVEWAFLHGHGIGPHCTWFKQLVGGRMMVYSSEKDNVYATPAFPAIRDAIADFIKSSASKGNLEGGEEWSAVQHEIFRAARAIERAAKILKGQLL
ncbi:unnamed protein product [Closterium sp. NIES-64]|nr:unnamed protein product [Closterium sp. NIES-64]